MAGEIRSYKTTAVQKQVSYPHGECVTLLIEFAKVIRGRRRNGDYEIISRTLIGSRIRIWLNLKRAKMLTYKRHYAIYIAETLLWMSVPREELARILQKIFEVIYKAISPEQPIYVVIECLIERSLDFETPTCAICLEDFAEREEEGIVTSIPCAHRYHQQCIDPWLKLKIEPLCPLCRRPCHPNPNPNLSPKS